ncbi:hypothetical protein [uncultured Rikenella sp.]|uniref:hypothetical protein n=1 Tax=uncultured Rikenella sp. TaxID=368003 RepID=UPI0025DBF772|nr:hypothetical protein [uncultured Rikenella sp.]
MFGGLGNTGREGTIWSASVTDKSYGICSYFTGADLTPNSPGYNGHGFPLRCLSE